MEEDSKGENHPEVTMLEDQTILHEVETEFINWAKQNLVEIKSLDTIEENSDLKEIAKAIGGAKVVALSEGFHNCKEMMKLHHRLIRYLVEHHGFNTVCSESGLPESRIVHDYVLGKDVNMDEMWKKGINGMYSEWNEGRRLIEFMRDFNLNHSNRLNYYGVDIGGFYKDWRTPLEMILQYLNNVDPEYNEQLSKQLKPYMEVLSDNARLNYSNQLSSEQRDDLARILDESLSNFDEKEEVYTSKDGEKEFQWARQSMISMQLAENYYRNIEYRRYPERSKMVGLNGREIAMARNCLWALKQQKDAKIVWIDHIVHTKTKAQYQDEMWGFFTPAGQILKQHLKEDYFSIGMLYNEGKFWNNWKRPDERFVDICVPWDTKSNSIEGTLSKCYDKRTSFFLHWGKLLSLKSLECLYWLRKDDVIRDDDSFYNIQPIEWDACIFLQDVSPATPAN